MSDLLSRLVARAIGEAKSPVEPVLASRYEPATQTPGFASLLETADISPVTTSRRIEPARRAKLAQDDSLSQETARRQVHEIEPPPQREEPDHARIRLSDEREVSLTPPALVAKALLPEREPEVETHRPNEGNADTVGAGVLAGNTGTRPTRDTRALAQSIESDLELIRPERPVVAPGAGNSPSARRGLGTETPFALSTTPGEVTVTIGTIEVRLAPPAKTPTRRAAPPKVSLDDYLARRSGSAR
ncbi:MAG: hypothetical protein ACJ72H_00060 [Candidatus Sulfotelmatobacter sp.]|jgi:hypothetical protein